MMAQDVSPLNFIRITGLTLFSRGNCQAFIANEYRDAENSNVWTKVDSISLKITWADDSVEYAQLDIDKYINNNKEPVDVSDDIEFKLLEGRDVYERRENAYLSEAANIEILGIHGYGYASKNLNIKLVRQRRFLGLGSPKWVLPKPSNG